MKKKIISIVGARPQFIKLAPLSVLINKEFRQIIIHTGQHYDFNMSKYFFDELNISKPDYFLNVGSGLHGEKTAEMLYKVEQILIKEKPSLVIVYGDTNSTLAGILAASKLFIKSIHIEAGLRSFNKNMPEEINRIVADHVSDYLFAPTKIAIKNLEKENLLTKSFLTGDIMVDSLKIALNKSFKSQVLEKYSFKKNSYYLLTLHRPYNVDNHNVLSSVLNNLGKTKSQIVFPIHPRTQKMLKNYKIKLPPNFILIDPIGYIDFVTLQKNAQKIITDSGGIQKEAYILKKPCITLRSETEWIETVKAGWNLLINPTTNFNYHKIIDEFWPETKHKILFGQKVANRMFEIIKNLL